MCSYLISMPSSLKLFNTTNGVQTLAKLLCTRDMLNHWWTVVTFSVLPLNLPRMLKRGTCGMISCSFSSLYKGAVGRSRVRNKNVDSDICSWYSSVRSSASFSSGVWKHLNIMRIHQMSRKVAEVGKWSGALFTDHHTLQGEILSNYHISLFLVFWWLHHRWAKYGLLRSFDQVHRSLNNSCLGFFPPKMC